MIIVFIIGIIALYFKVGMNLKYTKKVEFKDDKPGYNYGYYEIDSIRDDVNGDGKDDDIVLIGKKEDFLQINSIKISITTGDNTEIITPKLTEGINPKIIIKDFNMDNVKDIFLRIDTGGNGGAGRSIYQIISYKDNKLKNIFGEENFSEGLNFRVSFSDNYKLGIENLDINKIFTIDISEKKEFYEEQGIYKNGRLIKNINGSVDLFFNLTPQVDQYGDVILIGQQYIFGVSISDAIGEVTSVLKYNAQNGKWIIDSIDIIRYKS